MGTREIKWDFSPGIKAIEAFPVIGDIIATTIAIQLTSVHITEGIGEGGIRTLGTLLGYGALAKRCFRPLSHLTKIGRARIWRRIVDCQLLIADCRLLIEWSSRD